MRTLVLIFVALGSVLLPIKSMAQTATDTVGSLPGIEIETAVDRAESYIGDLITYTLTITYDSTYDLIPPPLGANLGAFDVKDYQPDIETKLDDGRLKSETIFTLSTYTTGEYIIPPLPVVFVARDSTRKVIMAEPVPITILSLLDMAGTDSVDIKPLKEPYDFPPDYSKYYLWGGIGAAVLILAALALGWWLWRRGKLPFGQEDTREPWEIAFEKLAFVRVEYLDPGIGDQPVAKAYYVALTEIVRAFVGRIYERDVLEMTTTQFLDTFREVELAGDVYKQLSDFFEHADRVKFARYLPERQRTEDDFLAAHSIVEVIRADYERRQQAETNVDSTNGDHGHTVEKGQTV